MKILFLCSLKFDYLQDLTYSGLVKILGKESVTDYPWNPKYHLPFKQYPKNLGYTSLSARLLNTMEHLSDYNLVIVGAAKQDVIELYTKWIHKLKHLPVIFLDGGDLPEIGGDCYRLNCGQQYESAIKIRPFDLILKREYLPELHSATPIIHPFPFSFPYNLHVPPVHEDSKKYEVSFWGQEKPDIRANALKLLNGKYDCAQNGTTLNQNFDTYKRKGKFYLEEIASCKIVLNFRGGGWDTMRYWEVPSVCTFMISQKPQIRIPDNFEEGKHLVWCDDSLGDLIEKIDYYLVRPQERNTMALNAKAHVEKYHLNTVRAQTLLNIAQKKISGR